jgi:hypothetical protein
MVGQGFDYHDNVKTDRSVSGTYTTEAVTTAVQNWITRTIKTNANAKTFAYVAHEAVHGPLEVPMRFIKGKCEELVPADYPSRLIYCGMVRAVDESVLNVTNTYKQLGLWEKTLFILSADNGGNPGDGGNNYPLRGNKATAWEGGVRGLGFISGAGLAPSVRGTISHDIVHATDWLPTLVAGVAGLPLNNETLSRPCIACDRAVAPLDGANQWPMFSNGAASARTEVLLDLQATVCWPRAASCDVPGMGALRIGKWKLVHGHTAVWSKATNSADQCVARSGTAASKATLPITANTSAPWCPNGWIPPPSTTDYQLPQPPTDAGCPGGKLPCTFPATSRYLAGSTFLFDVVSDPFEHHDVAAENPAVVAKLMQRLQQFNSSHCGGSRCEPDAEGGAKGKPTKEAAGEAWLPWRGSLKPSECDTNRTAAGPAPHPKPTKGLHSSLDTSVLKFSSLSPPTIAVQGWCWDGDWAGRGLPPMTVEIKVDNTIAVAKLLANVTRAGLPSKTGAPNPEHGFKIVLEGKAAQLLASAGAHTLSVGAYKDPAAKTTTVPLKGSPACFKAAKLVPC